MTKQQIIATMIVSLVATGLIELLKPALRALWARMNRPSPLSLQGKVQLAGQVAIQEKTLERLNHMSAHSRDVFLYLFQLALAIFISVGAALFKCITDESCHRLFRVFGSSNRCLKLQYGSLLSSSRLAILRILGIEGTGDAVLLESSAFVAFLL
jgi:hypothetical protein